MPWPSVLKSARASFIYYAGGAGAGKGAGPMRVFGWVFALRGGLVVHIDRQERETTEIPGEILPEARMKTGAKP